VAIIDVVESTYVLLTVPVGSVVEMSYVPTPPTTSPAASDCCVTTFVLGEMFERVCPGTILPCETLVTVRTEPVIEPVIVVAGALTAYVVPESTATILVPEVMPHEGEVATHAMSWPTARVGGFAPSTVKVAADAVRLVDATV
jgi:hypothetical protein